MKVKIEFPVLHVRDMAMQRSFLFVWVERVRSFVKLAKVNHSSYYLKIHLSEILHEEKLHENAKNSVSERLEF